MYHTGSTRWLDGTVWVLRGIDEAPRTCMVRNGKAWYGLNDLNGMEYGMISAYKDRRNWHSFLVISGVAVCCVTDFSISSKLRWKDRLA